MYLYSKKNHSTDLTKTLPVSVTFAVMTFAVIFIVAALSFFPALSLGPIAEYFSL